MNESYGWKCGLGLMTAVAAGCGAQEPEPAAQAADLLSFAIDPFTSGEQLGEMKRGPGRFLWLASQCDASPEIESTEFHGHPFLENAAFDWQDCTIELPEGAPFSEITTSGELTIASSVGAEGGLERTATFVVEREIEEGLAMQLTGTSTIRNTDPADHTLVIEVDLSREMTRDGSVGGSGALSGVVSVTVDADQATRTISGTLSMSMENPHFGSREMALELTNVVRVHHDVCQYPIGGQIRRSSEGEEHTLEYSSVCGEATLDGEPVDLAELAQRNGGHGRGRP